MLPHTRGGITSGSGASVHDRVRDSSQETERIPHLVVVHSRRQHGQAEGHHREPHGLIARVLRVQQHNQHRPDGRQHVVVVPLGVLGLLDDGGDALLQDARRDHGHKA